jgi:PAS domain S-box-containing protein
LSEIEQLHQQVEELQAGLAASQAEAARLKQEIQAQQLVFSGSPEALLLTDLRGMILQASQAVSDLTGYSLAELAGMDLRRLDLELTEEEMSDLGAKAILEGQARFETLHRRRDGRLIPVEVRARYLPLGGGRFAASLRDVQEQHRLDQALQNELNRYRAMVNSAMDGSCIWDGRGRLLEISPVLCQMTGFSQEELLGMGLRQLDAGLEDHTLESHLQAARMSGAAHYETLLHTRSGELRQVEASVHYLPVQGGMYITFLREISQGGRALRALRESEEKFRALAEQSMVGIAILQGGRLVYTNPGLSRITGYLEREMLGWTREQHNQLVLAADRPLALEQQRQNLEREEEADARYTYRICGKDGQARWVEQFSRRFQYEGQPATLLVFVDIDQRERASEQLELLVKEKQAILDSLSTGVCLVRGRQVVWSNISYARIVGSPAGSVEGLDVSDLYLKPQDYEVNGQQAYLQMLRGETFNGEYEFKRLDGQVIWASLGGRMLDPAQPELGSIWVVRDVSQRRQAEADVRRALGEKDALLRELYHRTNNNMQVIIALLDMQASASASPELWQAYQEMKNRIYSMALVHERLYQSQNLHRLELGSFLEQIASELVDAAGPGQDQVTLGGERQEVWAPVEAAMPCGLLVNELVTNSLKHAFPGDRAGEIRVSLRQAADGEVTLQVADNGVGLPVEAGPRSSMRMGLSIVSTLAQQLQGRVEFETDGGTTCRVVFRLK